MEKVLKKYIYGGMVCKCLRKMCSDSSPTFERPLKNARSNHKSRSDIHIYSTLFPAGIVYK